MSFRAPPRGRPLGGTGRVPGIDAKGPLGGGGVNPDPSLKSASLGWDREHGVEKMGGPQILEPPTPGCCSIRRRKTEEILRVPIRLVKTEDFEENLFRFPRES